MSVPKIVFFTSSYIKGEKMSDLEAEEFLKYIINEEIRTVFSMYTPARAHQKERFLFTIKEGFVLNVRWTNELNSLEKFFDISKLNFNDFMEFLDAQFIGIKNGEIFRRFKNSKFWGTNRKSFQDFLEAEKGSFIDRNSLNRAKQLKTPNQAELDRFSQSGYRQYQELLDSEKNGFKQKEEFYEAKDLGITTYEEYKKNALIKFKSDLEKIDEVVSDAEKALGELRFEESIRLNYLSIEMWVKLLHLSVFGEETRFSEDQNIKTILEKIQQKVGTNKINFNELDKWRRVRNDIAHEHLKVSMEEAKTAARFLTDTRDILLDIFKKQ